MAEAAPTRDSEGKLYSFRERVFVRTIHESADEIRRLRGWLSYIEGNFRSGPECARSALDGDPIPDGFLPSPDDI